jgi:hypothetical protein
MNTTGILDRNRLVKGTDFLYFYTMGQLANDHHGEYLYDMNAQAVQISRSEPAVAGMSYVSLYGPQVALFFAPLALLPYASALALWLLLNVLIYAFCCYAIWKTCSNLQGERWTVLVLAIAFPGFFHLLAWGQTSGMALLFFTFAYLALRANNPWAAGFAIGCLIFKPQLGLAAAVIFLYAQQWRVVFGALCGAALQLTAGWLYFGASAMRDYARALWHVSEVFSSLEPRPYQMHSLRSLWDWLLPWPHFAVALYALSAIGVLAIATRCWKSSLPLGVRFSALLIATVLVSPHLTVYDLVILAPAFLLLSDWLLANQRIPSRGLISLLLYLCYPLFLLGPLTRFTHVQLSVIVMGILLWSISTMARVQSSSIATTR